MTKSKYPLRRLDLPTVAAKAVTAAVNRGISNIDELYISAERGARRAITRAYNAMTPAVINNRTAAGRRAISRASNIQRAQNGMLHQYLTTEVLDRVLSTAAAKTTRGDLKVNGELVECKRTLRERRRQIFADGNHVKAVIVRSVDADDKHRHSPEYVDKHGATLVVVGGYPGALSLTQYAAKTRAAAKLVAATRKAA